MNPENFLWSQLSADSLIPIAASLAGVIWAITYAIRQPQLAEIKIQAQANAEQISSLRASFEIEREAWEGRLKYSEKCEDEYREKLRICQDTNAELGRRIRDLEALSKADHDHPLPE